MSFASYPSSQGPSPRILSLNACGSYPLSFHHFVLAISARLSRKTRTRKLKSATTSLCWGTTHSPGISLQSKKARLSSLLARIKSIWLECCRMDLPGPTTSVGTRTDYSVGPWDYPACATRHLKAWSTRTAKE
jgi:hypothetical protein